MFKKMAMDQQGNILQITNTKVIYDFHHKKAHSLYGCTYIKCTILPLLPGSGRAQRHSSHVNYRNMENHQISHRRTTSVFDLLKVSRSLARLKPFFHFP